MLQQTGRGLDSKTKKCIALRKMLRSTELTLTGEIVAKIGEHVLVNVFKFYQNRVV